VDTVRRVIDVVLPALDESLALPRVLASIPAGYHAIVVDNGSSDDTATRAAELGAQVVSEPVRGFGAACFAGLLAAHSEVVAFMDCDASLDGRELPRVCAPVVESRAELVLGARRPGDRAAWSVHGRVANSALARTVSRTTGARITDLGPMRAAHRLALLDLGIQDRRFGWPLEMVLRAGHAGWRIEEVPVAYQPRVGRSKVTGSLRGTARAVVDMARVLARTRLKSERA
jgi:glycosyltransferase involved in cell wall biosynthesis